MSNYRRAKLVFDTFRSRSNRLLFTSRNLTKDVTGRPIWRSSTLPSNQPNNFRGFFSSLIKSVSHVGSIIKTAQGSTSPFLGRANTYNLPRVRVRVRAPNRKRTLYVVSFVGSVAVIVLCCFGKFETIPFSNRTHFVIFTPTLENKLGDLIIDFMKEDDEYLKGKILPDTHPQTIRVRGIANKITEALQREMATNSHSDGKKWEILVVNDPQLSAKSLIDGTILLSTGLLDHLKRDEEIATIIGHEVGHVVARHTTEKLTNPMLVLTLVRHSLHRIFEYYDSYYFPRLTIFWFNHLQRMELEADYIGMLLLASAGYDPRVAPDVITKLHKLKGQDPNRKYCFSAHPSGKERVDKLTQEHVMQEALSRYWDMQAGYIKKEEYLCNDYALQYIDEDKHV